MSALVVLAAGAVAYRTIAGDSEGAPARPSYRALLAADDAAVEACRGPEIRDLEGGRNVGADEGIAAIARDVERIRGLEFNEIPETELVSEEEMAARLGADTLTEDESIFARQIRVEDRILTLLGALDPSLHLRNLYRGIPLGIYLDHEDVILVLGSEDFFDAETRTTVAHELAHALVDQHFGFEEIRPLRGDPTLAAAALVEGDATLTDFRFGRWAFSTVDRWLVDFASDAFELAGAPPSHFLARQAAFPYRAGPAFACFLYLHGGWDEVNDAYTFLPTTTAQVLFPRRYLEAEDAVRPEPAAALPPPWRFGVGAAFGAAQLMWLFEAPGDDRSVALDEPLDRAAAWAGGELRLWVDGEHSALLLSLVQRPGEEPLCASVSDWYAAAFPESRFLEGETSREWLVADGAAQDAVVSCFADEVRVGIAPDLGTARALVADP